MEPFTIRLKLNEVSFGRDLRLKLDPGSVTTGMAIVDDRKGKVVWAAELTHRGKFITKNMRSRSIFRKARRGKNTRYRPMRFSNRNKRDGWVAPSLMSRVYNILTWVRRISKWANITSISVETCKFDMQKMQLPSIKGKAYQRGELFGYEVREYLLTKFNYTCVYCGAKKVPLQIEHVIPKSKGGTNTINNLVLACEKCNQKKGSISLEDFLKGNIELLNSIKLQLKSSLKDAAAVNITRKKLLEELSIFGLPIEIGYGYKTKYNRDKQFLPKAHWIDAACVGESTPSSLDINGMRPLLIRATGHGSRRMCTTNKFGIPIKHREQVKVRFGFQTGDIGKASVLSGKLQGEWRGRIITRKTGSFHIGEADGIRWKNVRLIQKDDGYSYSNSISN